MPDVCLQNCVFSPCWTVSSHSVCFFPSHGRPIQTDRPFPTELWVIGIQNHPNNGERATISGDIPSPLMPLFKTHTEVVLPTPNQQWGCFACRVVGSWSLGCWEWQRRREVALYAWGEISFRSVFSPLVDFCRDLWPVTSELVGRWSLSVNFSSPMCQSQTRFYSTNHTIGNINEGRERWHICSLSSLGCESQGTMTLLGMLTWLWNFRYCNFLEKVLINLAKAALIILLCLQPKMRN